MCDGFLNKKAAQLHLGVIVICITRLENVILQVQARFEEQRRQPRRYKYLQNIF
jgi:hypothetical protein